MNLTHQNSRILFGLKVKQIRQRRDMSFKDLSKATGLSVSYLNEIEKGKKSPKPDKIQTLATALGTSYEDLTSNDLSGALSAVGKLLHSNFLNELPLDLFGIDLAKVVEIIANAPVRVGAFISTMVELSRSYAFKEENFYFNAVRAYQELHYNYFEDIEQQIATFIESSQLPSDRPVPVNLLARLLKKQFGYRIVETELTEYPELQHLRSVYLPEKKTLYLNPQMNEKQKALQLGKELAYNYLKLEERIYTSSFLRVKNFQTVLHNLMAGYFAVGILVHRDRILQDLTYIFEQPTWENANLLQLLMKYDVSPEVLFQRFNLLPRHFGMSKLFFIRVIHDPKTDFFEIDKELHLNRQHEPHANSLEEHYCRRWLSIGLLKDLADTDAVGIDRVKTGVQLSRYTSTDDEYFCVTVARPAYFPSKNNVSVTIGLLVDKDLREKVRFLDDPKIPARRVGVTCERCPLTDCRERAAPPVVLQRRQAKTNVESALERLSRGPE